MCVWPACLSGGVPEQGVTFAVVNAAKTDDGGKDDNGEDSQLLTYALRIKNPSKLAEFTAVVNEHKSGTKQVRVALI